MILLKQLALRILNVAKYCANLNLSTTANTTTKRTLYNQKYRLAAQNNRFRTNYIQ